MSFQTAAWSQPPHPAYNTVPVRTTLLRPMATPGEPTMSPAAQKPKKKDMWTTPVREYVARAFHPDNNIEGISTADVQVRTKEIIQYYAERNMQEQIDWADYPLPQQILAEERVSAKAAPAVDLATILSLRASMNASNGTTNNSSPALNHNSNSKKRKSLGMDDSSRLAETSVPPWHRTNLEARITFADGLTDQNGPSEKRQKKNALAAATSKLDKADLEKRKQRFQLGKGNKLTSTDEAEMPTGPVVGLNEKLEKPYFRLTAPPKPETVRPLRVLEKTLGLLTKKWKEENNYNYICNQFKSLRQDLTVQHIKNAFTVKVYEIHARIALEKEDLGEYNQCQTQLRALYAQNLGGHPHEFLAYRILYFVYTCNKTDMNDLLAELTPADKAHDWIKHALDVRSALALGNYHKFFQLYLEANAKAYMGGYLMDMFVERERFNALANISKAYIAVTMDFLTDELAFEEESECLAFFQLHGVAHLIDGTSGRVKVKQGSPIFEQLRASAFAKVDIKGQI